MLPNKCPPKNTSTYSLTEFEDGEITTEADESFSNMEANSEKADTCTMHETKVASSNASFLISFLHLKRKERGKMIMMETDVRRSDRIRA